MIPPICLDVNFWLGGKATHIKPLFKFYNVLISKLSILEES